jgi:cyclase
MTEPMHAGQAPESAEYQFEQLADHVIFGRALREGTALSNTGIVDLGGSILAFDTGLTLHAGRAIRAASIARTGKPPSLVANSHWHLDHVLGNQVFAGGPIYATKRTTEILLEKRSELESELTPEKLRSEIRELERQAAEASTSEGRAAFDVVLRINRTLLEESAELKLTPPSSTFEGELKLPGSVGARLVTFGSGHTESDSVLFLEATRILFAGDLIVAGTHPNLTSGDPEHWLTVLDRIEELRPERIAPGHGPLRPIGVVAEIRDYLETLLRLAREEGTSAIPSRFSSWTEPEQFTSNLAYARKRATPPRR